MYEHIIPLLQKEFEAVHAESYQDINPSSNITYPYLTWSFQDNYLEYNVDDVYLDIDIFSRETSTKGLYDLIGSLRKHFEHLEILTDDIYFRVLSFSNGMNVPKTDETLKQRHLELHAKIDWRKN